MHTNQTNLILTAQAMVAHGKGILAMDESTDTIGKRFLDIAVENTEENRRTYRELLVSASGLGHSISGAILFDETLRQKTKSGVLFTEVLKNEGVIPGIKVDKGAKDLAGFPKEKITEGLDGLRDRLKEYAQLGAKFAKWRAVITIGKGVGKDGKDIPTLACIQANAHALARYAALCQEQGIVPIVEPEVLMDGDHTIERCYEVTEQTLRAVFCELQKQHVQLEGMVLKPNMVISGTTCPVKASPEQVAQMTVVCMLRTVPAAVPGIAFLSGGQSDEDATKHLNLMNVMYKTKTPWRLTFSYGRGMQREAMYAWKGHSTNAQQAQTALLKRAEENGKASEGML